MTHETEPITIAEPAEEGRVAHFFGLRGDAWMRHANPLSVWTRFSCLSLVVIAVWSRAWIGWYCLIPVAATSAWMWLNPRLFDVPASTRNWASKAVFGERIWLDRKNNLFGIFMVQTQLYRAPTYNAFKRLVSQSLNAQTGESR
jgi:hypothetical protein